MDSSRASRASRSASQSAPVVSATTSAAVGPASSTPDSSKVSRTAAHTRARGRRLVDPEPAGPLGGRRTRPGDLGVEVPRVDPATGEHAHAGREGHRGLAPQQVDLGGPGGTGTQQHDRRGVARLGRRAGAVGVRPRLLHQVRRQRDPHQSETTSSTSTGTSSGSAAHPDGRPGVPAGVAEHLAEQLGGAVRDLRLAGEVRRRGHEDHDLDDPLDRPTARRSRP